MNVADALFVLGCQRSGTTLLRFLLGSHPDVTGVDEAAAYPVLSGQRTLAEVLGDEPLRARLAFKIPRLSEQLLEPDVRDETYGTMPQFYAGQRAVFVTRDPRDVVSSMCTLKASAERTWIDAYGRAMVEHRVQQRAGFAARYGRELEALAAQDWPSHLVAAFYWQIKNDALPAYAAAGLPILPLRYELLVADPEPHLRRLFAHLGLPWTPAVLRHHEQRHGQLEEGGLAIGGSDPHRPIDASSVGRHATALTPAQVGDVERWAAPTLAALEAVLRR